MTAATILVVSGWIVGTLIAVIVSADGDRGTGPRIAVGELVTTIEPVHRESR